MIKNSKPEVKSYSITVAVPVVVPIIAFPKNNIHDWEENFIMLREHAHNVVEELCYDKCRATLKWAQCCGATLQKTANSKDASAIEFTFGFYDLRSMIDFANNLEMSVVGAVS